MMTSPIQTLEQHLLAALDPAPQETRRLFHGRGRRWPGLEQVTADWLEGVLLVSLFREPEAEELAALRTMLTELADSEAWRSTGARSLMLQHALLGRQAQVVVDETEIDPGARGDFDS